MDSTVIDDMDSDTCVGSKIRITEIEGTLGQQQETCRSLSTVSTRDESKESSSLIVSSPKEEQEIAQDNLSPSSFKKVKCSFTSSEGSFSDKEEFGLEENLEKLVSVNEEKEKTGSFGCERTSNDLDKKVKNFCVEVQETENSVMGFISECKKRHGETESGNDVKEEKKKEKDYVNSEIGFSAIEEFDNHGVSGECKATEVEMASVTDENKEFSMAKEMEAENLLEAKKQQLLAELDSGSIFKDKIPAENAAGLDTNAGILGTLKGIDESVRCSLHIEVIDDTALIQTVSVPKTGNGSVKIADMNEKKNEKQETEVKKARQPRHKGQRVTKILETSERPKEITEGGEIQNGGQKNGNQMRRKYSRDEMEALRFVNIVEQRKLWRDICTGPGGVVVKEYDYLASSKHQKKTGLNFVPPQHYGRYAPGILRKVPSENVDNELENMEQDEVKNMNILNPCCSQSIDGEHDFTHLEEECSEEDDSDDACDSIQRPAFLVEGEPNFDSGPPEDGLEYLRRVRWEAAHIPKVTVAKLDRRKVQKEQSIYMPQIPDIAKCPEHLQPLKQWADAFLADFSELRMFLSRSEDFDIKNSCKLQLDATVHDECASSSQLTEKFNNLRTDEVHSCKTLDGSTLENTIDQPSMVNAENSKMLRSSQNLAPEISVGDGSCNYPTLSSILAMDSVAQVSMLRKRICVAETMNTLSKNDCAWLFALCAAVDTPLDADTCAALRSLLRKCASLRAGKSELDDEVVMLNILTTIAGRYFGQSES